MRRAARVGSQHREGRSADDIRSMRIATRSSTPRRNSNGGRPPRERRPILIPGPAAESALGFPTFEAPLGFCAGGALQLEIGLADAESGGHVVAGRRIGMTAFNLHPGIERTSGGTDTGLKRRVASAS